MSHDNDYKNPFDERISRNLVFNPHAFGKDHGGYIALVNRHGQGMGMPETLTPEDLRAMADHMEKHNG